jgi:hypothetical protein
MTDPAPGVLAADPDLRRQVIARNAFTARALVQAAQRRREGTQR